MSQAGEDWLQQPQELKPRRIKLRRTQIKLEDNIPILNNRIRAQQLYYGQKHESPLIRSIATLGDEAKAPVHQRLGRPTKRLIRTYPRPNTVYNYPAPNQLPVRLRRMGNGSQTFRRSPNGIQTLKRTPNGIQTLRRTQYFKRNPNRPNNPGQQRLHRIRLAQQVDTMMQGDQVTRKLFKRRPGPTNFTVQVDNTRYSRTDVPAIKAENHSVRGSVDPQTRMEIEIIQRQSVNYNQHIRSESIFVAGYGFTGIFLNDRFCKLP